MPCVLACYCHVPSPEGTRQASKSLLAVLDQSRKPEVAALFLVTNACAPDLAQLLYTPPGGFHSTPSWVSGKTSLWPGSPLARLHRTQEPSASWDCGWFFFSNVEGYCPHRRSAQPTGVDAVCWLGPTLPHNQSPVTEDTQLKLCSITYLILELCGDQSSLIGRALSAARPANPEKA